MKKISVIMGEFSCCAGFTLCISLLALSDRTRHRAPAISRETSDGTNYYTVRLILKSDERFACQYLCGPPPKFPLPSSRSDIVHHLLCPDMYALA